MEVDNYEQTTSSSTSNIYVLSSNFLLFFSASSSYCFFDASLLPLIPLFPCLKQHNIVPYVAAANNWYSEEVLETHKHFTRFQRKLEAMDPNTKAIIEEMNKRFFEFDLQWEKCFQEQDQKKDERMVVLEAATASIESWKPRMEFAVNDMMLEVVMLNKHWERMVLA